ncbi:MAG: transposase, partial [bacterium]
METRDRLVYHLPEPRPDGQTVLYLTAREWLDRVMVLIPPPQRHRHRYHGVLAPDASPRAAVTAPAGLPREGPAHVPHSKRRQKRAMRSTQSPRARYLWARRLARIDEVFPLLCPPCGEPIRIIALADRRGVPSAPPVLPRRAHPGTAPRPRRAVHHRESRT